MALIGWAEEKGKMPSEVYQMYLANPLDFALLFKYRTVREEHQKKEAEKAKGRGPRKALGRGK